MKTKSIITGLLTIFFGILTANSQINLGDKAMGAIGKGLKAFTFSNEEAAAISKEAVDKMDKENKVAGLKDPYMLRLDKIFSKHKADNGLALNYKVYLVKDVNAFATADGSVRVFSGLMDIMDDNELLAVIGHEIGHIANNDSRDAIKAAYKKEFVIESVASQSDKVAKLSETQLAKLGSVYLDSKHSRQQESEADLYSYDFMKRNKYNVNAVASAFSILAKMSEGTESSFIDKMMSSHPDPKERAENAKKRAEDDGLYKPYVKQVKAKAPVKKAVKKKK